MQISSSPNREHFKMKESLLILPCIFRRSLLTSKIMLCTSKKDEHHIQNCRTCFKWANTKNCHLLWTPLP